MIIMEHKFIGIDISKRTFGVSFLEKNEKWVFYKFTNDETDFKKFEKLLDRNSHIVMEA